MRKRILSACAALIFMITATLSSYAEGEREYHDPQSGDKGTIGVTYSVEPTYSVVIPQKITLDKYDAVNDCFAVSRVPDSRKTYVEYKQDTMYTVTIPAKVDLGSSAEISVEDVNLPPNVTLKVGLTETSDEDNAFKLKLKKGTDKISYAVRKLDS